MNAVPTTESEPTHELLERSVKSLRWRYALALCALAVLVLLGGVMMYGVLVRHEAINAHVMSVVGRQRMLSQRLCKTALALVTYERADDRARYRAELQTALAEWQVSHEQLLRSELMRDASAPKRALLREHFDALVPEYEAMARASRRLLDTPPDVSEKKLWEDVEPLLAHERPYLTMMEQIIKVYVLESSERDRHARWLGIGLVLALLVTLVLEGGLVFRPALRQLAGAVSKIAEVWARVRRRERELSTLLGALPDLILRYTAEGEYIDAYKSRQGDGSGILGHVRGRPIRELMPAAQAAECLERFQLAQSHGRVECFECMLPVGPGGHERIHVELRIFTLQPAEVVVLIRDVTQQRQIDRLVLEAVEQEQQRLGRELHDGVCQSLSGMNLMIRAALQKIRLGGPVPVKEELFVTLSEYTEQASADARRTVRGLVPIELDAHGLAASLSKLVEWQAGHGGIQYTTEIALHGYEPTPEEAQHLYRIAQEAVSNALRHGAPSRISLSLICEASSAAGQPRRELVLKIDDDGSGIPENKGRPGELPGRVGMGLRTMAYRAQSIGAWLRIGRSHSGGTLVICRLPLTYSPAPDIKEGSDPDSEEGQAPEATRVPEAG